MTGNGDEARPRQPYVCGVDLGGKRARLCFLDPGDVKHPMMVRFEPTREQLKSVRSHVDVARWAANTVPPVWAQFEPLVVWFEQPFGPARGVAQLNLMAGGLLSGLSRSVGVEFVSAVECRKLCGIEVRSSKALLVAWATAEADADFEWDDHDADAYIVARAILAHGAREVAA